MNEYGATKCWSLVVNCHVLVEFDWFVVQCHWNLSVSLFLFAKVDFGCSSFVGQKRTIPPQNGNLLLRIEALHGIIILSLPINRIERSGYYFSLWLLDIFPDHLSLGSTAPFDRSSSSVENSFIISLRVTMPAASLSVRPKTQLQEGVLSSCGCSLTLTVTTPIGIWHSAGATISWFLCATTVLFSTTSVWFLFRALWVRVSSYW